MVNAIRFTVYFATIEQVAIERKATEMASSALNRQTNATTIPEEIEQPGNDSCPMLGEEENPDSNIRPQRILNVRRIDNGALRSRRSLVQRIQSRKNRFIQRVLVVCRLAEPSRDLTFKQAQTSNRAAIDQLTTIRRSLFDHSQSVVNLSTAIGSFTRNSSHPQDHSHDVLTNIAAVGHKIRESALAFSDQAEKSVLVKIDRRITELEDVHSLIEERAKLVLEVEYAQRTLAVENKKGNVNRVAERKQALQAAQFECERSTRLITEQLQYVHPNQDIDVLELFQEILPRGHNLTCVKLCTVKYAQLAEQFFNREVDLIDSEAKSQ
ncbi:Hypothetical protein PHPALM_15669 [Phytophthora palmivora]|uniref:Uncharacterized protein n=1 Tax=Phytophthora palmivora TaxID=4796 RepID=A0A2P4XRK2_9STRA|nr:Hypothetical protein PHPALM_15669 [Phytophthora palmivora]